MSRLSIPRARSSACPLCGAPVTAAHTPFCSQGCRDRDLLNWLGEGYRAPGPAAAADGQEIDTDGLDTPADRPL